MDDASSKFKTGRVNSLSKNSFKWYWWMGKIEEENYDMKHSYVNRY
jgi:hypothetical protein